MEKYFVSDFYLMHPLDFVAHLLIQQLVLAQINVLLLLQWLRALLLLLLLL